MLSDKNIFKISLMSEPISWDDTDEFTTIKPCENAKILHINNVSYWIFNIKKINELSEYHSILDINNNCIFIIDDCDFEFISKFNKYMYKNNNIIKNKNKERYKAHLIHLPYLNEEVNPYFKKEECNSGRI